MKFQFSSTVELAKKPRFMVELSTNELMLRVVVIVAIDEVVVDVVDVSYVVVDCD